MTGKTSQLADQYVSAHAGSREFDLMRAARAACNSDSAFVAWCRRGRDLTAIRESRLLQQTWKHLGFARSTLITLKAIKAAMLKLAAKLRVSPKKLFEILRAGVKKPAMAGAGAHGAQPQQDLFAAATPTS